jgi:hypothetical protein
MFSLKFNREPSQLDHAIATLLSDMEGYAPETPEYKTMLARLTKLYKLKALDRPERVSKDTVALVVGNLAGILLITHYEQIHVVTSKAVSFVIKPR